MPLVDFGCSMQIPNVLLITVDKSAYHHLSQNEIAGDNPCSRQLSGIGSVFGECVNQEFPALRVAIGLVSFRLLEAGVCQK
jgi:hypothetical protein